MGVNLKYLELDNDGERLIPGYSHNSLEIIRHRSTYQVFRKVIEQDILSNPLLLKEKIRILDLGCGSGHGSFMLAQIPNTHVYAIDVSEKVIRFAENDYSKENIIYMQANAEDFLNEDIEFDYVVSRHALEHIKDAVNIVLKFKYKNRLLVSVPYKEAEGNPFHLYNNIDETFFSSFPNKEFIYENLQGVNDVNEFQAEITNSITCISSKVGFGNVRQILNFPQQPYEFNGLEKVLFYFQEETQRLQGETQRLQGETQRLQDECSTLYNSRGMRMVRLFKKILGYIGIARFR